MCYKFQRVVAWTKFHQHFSKHFVIFENRQLTGMMVTTTTMRMMMMKKLVGSAQRYLGKGQCIENQLPSQKLTCPLKNSVWKTISFFFWTDPFRGDMLVCRGVALVTRTKGRMKSNEMEWYTTPNLNLWYNLASPKKSMVSLVPLSVEIMNSRYFKLKSLILSSERRPGLGWASNWSPPNHSLGWGDASSVVITRIIT